MTEAPLFQHCPIGCNSALIETDISLPEGRLKRCPECGQLLSACGSQWYEKSMREFNTPEGTLPSGKAEKRYQKRMGDILTKAYQVILERSHTPVLLDVGCSSGALLKVAKASGFEAQGVEPAEQAAATARSLGYKVHTGLLDEAAYPDNSFDVITLFEVIEHLTQPIELLYEIRRILKPGGLLLIGTGNADSWTVSMLKNHWEYFDIKSHGGHISFYNPSSMRLLAKKTGLEVSSISTKRVNMAERKDVSAMVYTLAKIGREVLALPARWLDKGHDMLVVMRKPTGD